jgi:DNA-binding transcriptional ArsR family regulator
MSTESLFKALADPNRRKILRLLKKTSLSAGEIADHFTITRASMSHHFNVLKSADLIRSNRHGQNSVYSLNVSVFEDLAAIMFDLFKPSLKGENSNED